MQHSEEKTEHLDHVLGVLTLPSDALCALQTVIITASIAASPERKPCLTQVQLASMVDVSPATISKWRAGTQAPERDALERLAGVVNVTPEWFTRAPGAKLSLSLFRSNASAHVAARAILEARLEWAQDVAVALMEYVDYPDVNLPSRDYTEPEEITNEDIGKAACECQDLWRLGRSAIQDLALAVEGAGVIVVREETGIAQIEGLSAWSEVLGRLFILLSADKNNGYRSRFDLAHEVGHLVLHRHIQRTTDSARHKLMEAQAHRFAGAFLLSAETFASEVRVPPTLDDLLLLKRRYRWSEMRGDSQSPSGRPHCI